MRYSVQKKERNPLKKLFNGSKYYDSDQLCFWVPLWRWLYLEYQCNTGKVSFIFSQKGFVLLHARLQKMLCYNVNNTDISFVTVVLGIIWRLRVSLLNFVISIVKRKKRIIFCTQNANQPWTHNLQQLSGLLSIFPYHTSNVSGL